MVDPVLSPVDYLLGISWLISVGGSAVWSARVVCRRALPGWERSARGLAVSVLVLAQVTLCAEATAAVGLLRPAPVLVTVLVTSAVMFWLARRVSPPPPSPQWVAPRSPTAERWLTTAAIAVVGAQWVAHTGDALSRGMTHADTLWYHGPYAARFLQTASLGDLTALGYGQSRYFPLGSELLHAFVALPFSRDLLSPLVNLGFGALALLAASVIGARWGAAALATLGVTAVLGLPTLAGTQPGQASNDVVAAALVLSALALLVRSEHRPLPMGLAGAALGLAAGTKVTVLALVGPIALGVVLVALRRGERAAARWWIGGAALTSGCWAVRNIVLTGTPIPFIDVDLGPIHHTAVAAPSGTPSIVRSILDGTAAGYRQGAAHGLGPLWPIVLLVCLGTVAALLRGPISLRVPAASAGIGAIAYAFTPYTGGFSFQYNLRYLTPSIFVAVVVLAAASAPHPHARRALGITLISVLATNLFAEHHERVAAWPGDPALPLLAGALIIGAALAAPRRPTRTGPGWVIAALALTISVGGGWFLQEHYLAHRYVEAGLGDDELNAAFRTVSGARVDVLGTPEVYPMFGADLSNDVRDRSSELYLDVDAPTDPCRHWRRELRRSDYVVASMFGFALRRFTPAEREAIFERDPAATVVVSTDGAVYRLDGPLDPATC